MPSVLEVPQGVYSACPGSVNIHLTEQGAAVYLRATPDSIGTFPQHVKAEVKLPSWESPPIVAVALLVRLGGRPDLTFQHWINAGNPHGIRTLQQFSRTGHLPVFVVTDRIARSHRASNTLRTKATYLVSQLAPRIHAWSHELYHETTARLDRLYTTPARLWGECLKAERQGQPSQGCGTLAT